MQSSPNSTSPLSSSFTFETTVDYFSCDVVAAIDSGGGSMGSTTWVHFKGLAASYGNLVQANKTLSDYINGEGGSTCSCWCKNRCVNTWLGCVHGSGMTIFDRSLDYELNTDGVYICFFISSFTDYKNTLFFVSIRNNLLWIDYWNGQFMLMFGFGCRMTISLTYELVCL